MCHTAVDRGALPEGSQRFVDAYLSRLTQGFRHALTQGHKAGELSSDADVDALADFFTVSLMGAAACMRADADPHQIRRACQVAITVLRSHNPTTLSPSSRASHHHAAAVDAAPSCARVMSEPSQTSRRLGTSSLIAGIMALILGLATAVFGAENIDPTGSGGTASGHHRPGGHPGAYTGVSRTTDTLSSALHDEDRES